MCVAASAQNSLSYSRHSSVYTYVYKITEKEAEALYRTSMAKVSEAYLHTLIDSFTKDADPLPAGNYLFARAVENRLNFEMHAAGDVRYKLLNNNRDLAVALHTKEGRLLTNATVYIANKKLHYDAATQTYRREKWLKGGLLQVHHNGVVYPFAIEQANSWRPPFFKRLVHSAPLKYIINPFKVLFAAENNRYNNYFYRTAHEQKFKGFVAFSKPKYKPGDTVKLKAFITTATGKPLTKHLRLRLTVRGLDIDSVIATITPYRPGGYSHSFVLSDSLHLDLDKEYQLLFEEHTRSHHSLTDYEDDEDEEAAAAKRSVVMRGKFYYEDYELNAISFAARSSKGEHSRGEEPAVYLKASDENGLAVMDGRVQLFVKTSHYSFKKFSTSKVFLRDTLWHYEGQLETLGETKISLPDSVFPRASFDYEVECIFLNIANERQTQNLYQKFRDEEERILFEETADSLRIEYLVKGKRTTTEATLYGFSTSEDTVEGRSIRLPATIKLHPFVQTYAVETAMLDEEYTVKNGSRIVSAQAFRTKDSVHIRLLNPYRLPVWYTVFAGNKILVRGYGDSLLYADNVRTAKNYFLSLQYVYNGEAHNEDFTIPYRDKLLTLTVVQPDAVYPGQTAAVTIDVKDARGGPVPGADVTAFAYTAKFKQGRLPSVPYFGKWYPGRRQYATFSEEDKDFNNNIKLAWQRWSREMRLDTIEYYKFLHPQSLYVNTEVVPDSVTQIAPFVVKNGDLQPVHLIYIDEVPVFFSAADGMQRYSFAVSPGKHSFRLRTDEALVSLDSFDIPKGVKTFISINAEATAGVVRVQKMGEALTPYERTLWSKYMLLVENNFGENYASINSGTAIHLLNRTNHNRPLLVGPLPNQFAYLTVKNGYTLRFETEGSYRYLFQKELVKQKSISTEYFLPAFLSHNTPRYDFHDYVLTEKAVDSLWQEYLYNRSAAEDLFTNPFLNKAGNGQLHIGVDRDSTGKEPSIRNLLLFTYNDPDFLRIYRGNARDLGYLPPGAYRLMLLLKGDEYFIKDSIIIKKDGLNYYATGAVVPKPADSVSRRISGVIDSRNKYSSWNGDTGADFHHIKELFNQKFLDKALFTETVSGVVTDNNGVPVAGASVMVKGTGTGAVTDRNGRFTLKAPPGSTLVIHSVGFVSEEKRIRRDSNFDFRLSAAKQSLSEVVVVGYGASKRRDLTGAVSTVSGDSFLQGKLPGVSIEGSPGSEEFIRIRGTASLMSLSKPLLIVDGLPYTGSMDDIDPALIASASVLKNDEAVKIYGAQAAAGVVIITTKKGDAALSGDIATPVASLRRNFRDDAYWQPRLITNSEGKVSFNVTYPDDITAWKTFAIAMTDNKQSGSAEGIVKSFKAISGNLAMPQFAVEGDSIAVIGKSLNYLMDSISAKRSFYINNNLMKEAVIRFRTSWIDTLALTAPSTDSLKLKYTVQKDDGYFDGEERVIPVFKKGVLEAEGFFAPLRGDTSFVIQPFSDTGIVNIYAETSVLPTLEKEVAALHRYEYLCNEQLASKLKGWLVQKRIDSFLKRPFKGDKYIRDLVSRLSQNKASSELWGWWAGNEPAMWISLHVLEALAEAKLSGYNTSLNNTMVVDYLLYNMDTYKSTEKIAALHLLHLLGAKADFKKFTDSLQRDIAKMTLYEKLRVAELKQKAGLEADIDSLLRKQSRTMLGNVYWGEESFRFFDNDIQCSIVMYRLLKAKGGNNSLLQKLQGYFLERRRSGQWCNTHETSLILETLLPDLLVNDSLPKPPVLTLRGTNEQVINRFPFAVEMSDGKSITVNKSGNGPVYFTAYQQRWNETPQRVAGDFTVKTMFEKSGESIMRLKAGSPVTLKIAVTVKADANYVMIEAPIPAGCSYNNKAQSYANNEVHREYFKNKVSIFCSALKKGEYVFTVLLLPRYTGRYTLNPAKAELMYFPVLYGREEMKTVVVE